MHLFTNGLSENYTIDFHLNVIKLRLNAAVFPRSMNEKKMRIFNENARIHDSE